ncbi:DUF3017 domain-containing protein [Dermacoccus abyssi]|uniref:DUF3017 domain-containing protein n=1 Tax=Dermacoccus abyssi TaxID=322596 RepID=A0ABX5ZDI4_9MICO|nr:DUF3017 domain-containing protein [Dermacoccus abyssi]
MTRFRLGIPWLGVVALVIAGLVTVMAGQVRVGGGVMALGLFAGAMMRAVLPERYVLDIKVRSRTVDIAGYALLAVVTLVAFGVVKLG